MSGFLEGSGLAKKSMVVEAFLFAPLVAAAFLLIKNYGAYGAAIFLILKEACIFLSKIHLTVNHFDNWKITGIAVG